MTSNKTSVIDALGTQVMSRRDAVCVRAVFGSESEHAASVSGKDTSFRFGHGLSRTKAN